MGTFWDSRAIHLESINPLLSSQYPYAYVGIDREVLVSVQNRDFDRLLKMKNGPERTIALRSDFANGVLYLDRYGVLRAWLDRVPDVIDFEVPGEL